MRSDRQKFFLDPSLEKEEMEEIQRQLSEQAVFEDRLEFGPEEVEKRKVVGIDQAFTEDEAVSAAVVVQDGEVIEKVHAVEDLEMPYIPGLLAFREAPAIISALQKLETDPDLLMLDGSGRIHYREAGIATHIGVMFGKPSIGVAKNLLCGEPCRKVDSLQVGEKVPIYSDERMETSKDKLIGYALQSRQHPESNRINPLYISPGHRVSADTSVGIVEDLGGDYKLPEPTRLADSYVDEVKGSV